MSVFLSVMLSVTIVAVALACVIARATIQREMRFWRWRRGRRPALVLVPPRPKRRQAA